jgi:hypothetical protein
MIKKYVNISGFKDLYHTIIYSKIYVLSLIILPICFLVNVFISRIIVGISFILFFIVIIKSCIESKKQSSQFEDISPIRSFIFSPIILLFADNIWSIAKFIYYNFLFGNLLFSLKIFSYIILWHFLVFLLFIFGFIFLFRKKSTNQNGN